MSTPDGNRRLRVLMTKAGLDAHERGINAVSLGLRDHGFDVILLPLRQNAGQVAAAAVQEDVDVVGVSSLAGGHLSFIRSLSAELGRHGAEPVLVVGGVIPAQDHPELRRLGVAEIFPAGSLVKDIAARLRELCG
jgi:methylmalonyl-CoA mutase cobalamin-binding domain/chain